MKKLWVASNFKHRKTYLILVFRFLMQCSNLLAPLKLFLQTFLCGFWIRLYFHFSILIERFNPGCTYQRRMLKLLHFYKCVELHWLNNHKQHCSPGAIFTYSIVFSVHKKHKRNLFHAFKSLWLFHSSW